MGKLAKFIFYHTHRELENASEPEEPEEPQEEPNEEPGEEETEP